MSRSKKHKQMLKDASECKLCNDITLEAKNLLMTGYSLKDVRKKIDDKYSSRGAGTNTSLPS